jgi:hypothetical protein
MQSRRKIWAGNIARKVEMIVAYKVLVGKSNEKRPFGRTGHKWEDNI